MTALESRWSPVREAAATALDLAQAAVPDPLDVDEPPADLPPQTRAALQVVKAAIIYRIVAGSGTEPSYLDKASS
jgi:hypothetical protein